MIETVYLNGQFLPRSEAKISPDDRGFIFADGVYEVIKFYNGKSFRFADHLERLQRSLSEISIEFTTLDEIQSVCNNLLKTNRLENKHAGVYIQITRGVAPRVHYFPQNIQPTIYAFASEMPSAQQKLKNGIKAITTDDIRWHRCDIKSVSLLPNTMLHNQAVKSGYDLAILVRNGVVTEATHSSLFAVKNGKLVTHPLSQLILPGITRKVVLEICGNHGIPHEEVAIKKEKLFEMDELFVAGTSSEITPVVQVDGQLINNKKPGEITRFIQQKFFELV